MKKRGNICDFKAARNEELKAAFFERLGNRRFGNICEIFADIATIPASRFFISETRAIELLKYRRRTGAFPPDMMKNRLKMIEEIERRVKEVMDANPELDFYDAVYGVVNSPAPSFYLTPGSVRSTLYLWLANTDAS